MNDYIIRAIAANDQIRAFAAVTTETVETASINTWRNNLFLKMFDSNSYCGISVKRNLPCNHFIHCDTQ